MSGCGQSRGAGPAIVVIMKSSKEIVLDAWRAFASHDAARIAPLFSPDAEWLAPPGNAAARVVGTHHLVGRERITRFIADEFPAVFGSEVAIDFRTVIAEGDTVVVEERMRATLPSGRPYDVEYCFVFELRDGLINRVREYLDTRRGLEMFGL